MCYPATMGCACHLHAVVNSDSIYRVTLLESERFELEALTRHGKTGAKDVLSIYPLPYNPDYPVVCMDKSNKQLIGEVRPSIPGKPGQPKRIDDEYIRNGVVAIFMEVESLAGKRHVAVTERRTRKAWARQMKSMLDERYLKYITLPSMVVGSTWLR